LPDDFSDARNLSTEYASSEADWIYWQDFDEALVYGEQLRKYLNTELFQGYVITQNHLTLDMQVKPDTPVRIYRNNVGIKFFGSIHEHCERSLDVPIDPILILPDVKIAHFGYITEAIRRHKCRDRNFSLLKKDREKYPNRQLGIVLLMRDYLNFSQWEVEETRGKITENIIAMMREVIKLYRQCFVEKSHIYHELAFPFYQRALITLGKNGIPIEEGTRLVPFEVSFALGGSVAGMSDPNRVRPEQVWFGDRQELEDFIIGQGKMLSDGLKLDYARKK